MVIVFFEVINRIAINGIWSITITVGFCTLKSQHLLSRKTWTIGLQANVTQATIQRSNVPKKVSYIYSIRSEFSLVMSIFSNTSSFSLLCLSVFTLPWDGCKVLWWVCPVCLSACTSQKPHGRTSTFLCMLTVGIACSSSGGVAMLWTFGFMDNIWALWCVFLSNERIALQPKLLRRFQRNLVHQ